MVLLSAFGSTYTVGMPVISAVNGLDSIEAALGNAISVFGVVIPLFTAGIHIAGYFGRNERGVRCQPPGGEGGGLGRFVNQRGSPGPQ